MLTNILWKRNGIDLEMGWVFTPSPARLNHHVNQDSHIRSDSLFPKKNPTAFFTIGQFELLSHTVGFSYSYQRDFANKLKMEV
jgi:hypothetical protein